MAGLRREIRAGKAGTRRIDANRARRGGEDWMEV